MINVEDCPGSVRIENTLNLEVHPARNSQWIQLPSLAIEKIYSYLGRKDQYQMSLVCTSWSKEYSSPSLWKTIKLYLTSDVRNVIICPEVKFARKYGYMCQYVEIVCKTVYRDSTIEAMFRQLELFLNALITIKITYRNSQLLSVRFKNLQVFRHLKDTSRANLFKTLILFLEYQYNLRNVEFYQSHFAYEQAAEVLTAITKNSGEVIRKLILRGFTYPQVAITAWNEATANSLNRMFFEKLSNLNSLEIDYSHIFQSLFLPRKNIIEDFKKTKYHALSRINLFCEGTKLKHLERIPPSVWRHLKDNCPNLMIDLYFLPGSQSRQETEFCMVLDMPLRQLNFILYERTATDDMDMDYLFNHLRSIKCNVQLEALHLICMQHIPNLAQIIIPFLQSCPLLKLLQLLVIHPMNGIEIVLRSWLDFRPRSLQCVHLTILYIRNMDDYLNLTRIVDRYVPILQDFGLTLNVQLNF